MKFILAVSLSVVCSAVLVSAQPRPLERTSASVSVKPAPQSFSARYEGGMFGYDDRREGTLKFDDANRRLVFLDKTNKELFGVSYASMLVIYPQSKSVTSTTGNVVKNLPLPGAGLAGLIKEKRSYLVLNYNDADVDVKGTMSFKIENRELLDSVLVTLAEKAALTQRGDAYFRPRKQTSDN